MANEGNKTNTHYSSLEARIAEATSEPVEPVIGQAYYDTANNRMGIYTSTGWKYRSFSTTTSTSTSTTSTSTSTTSTSSSTSSSTSITTSTSTSTTTTL